MSDNALRASYVSGSMSPPRFMAIFFQPPSVMPSWRSPFMLRARAYAIVAPLYTILHPRHGRIICTRIFPIAPGEAGRWRVMEVRIRQATPEHVVNGDGPVIIALAGRYVVNG